jgi:uncharacterized protein (TIGR03790 family)
MPAAYALEPNEIIIIANKNIRESVELAQYYCAKRGVPEENILSLSLLTGLSDIIIRADYEKELAEPIRKKLLSDKFAGKIRCLLTTYGVPIKLSGRGPLKDQQDKIKQLEILIGQEKNKLKQLKQGGLASRSELKKKHNRNIVRLQAEINRILGKETGACVDSELSMVMFDEYELYLWQPNKLSYKMPYWDFKSLMVCRLDGPSFGIAKDLVNKAISAEQNGLSGMAYIDWGYSAAKSKESLYYKYDQSLQDLAALLRLRTQIPVVEEKTEMVFSTGQCPFTAIYCGWYSLKNYVDAFNFVDGAIGYHISSLEAVDIRDPNSGQWCPAMLKDGITATLGAVAEPYLHSFPKPKEFFEELLDSRCLVEAYYHTKPHNSWQMVLIGDPLYKPFPKSK